MKQKSIIKKIALFVLAITIHICLPHANAQGVLELEPVEVIGEIPPTPLPESNFLIFPLPVPVMGLNISLTQQDLDRMERVRSKIGGVIQKSSLICKNTQKITHPDGSTELKCVADFPELKGGGAIVFDSKDPVKFSCQGCSGGTSGTYKMEVGALNHGKLSISTDLKNVTGVEYNYDLNGKVLKITVNPNGPNGTVVVGANGTTIGVGASGSTLDIQFSQKVVGPFTITGKVPINFDGSVGGIDLNVKF